MIGMRIGAATLVIGAAALLGCGEASVKNISASPEKYDGKTVKVNGTVREFRTFPGAGPKSPPVTLYSLSSGSDTVWVKRGEESSAAGLPLQNQRIEIEARVVASETLRGEEKPFEPLLVELNARQNEMSQAPRSVTAP